VNLKKFSFITKLEENYEKNPVYCAHCGKVVSFKKFYAQFENSQKYCSKKCSGNYEMFEPNGFKSETEKIIYTYLSLTYPQYQIKHNIKDVFPPYELDICIETDYYPIWVECEGSMHFSRSNGKLQKSSQRHQLNDVIKRNEICDNRQQKMIRIWYKALYSHPELFEKCLITLEDKVNYLITAKNNYGQCLDIVADPNDQQIYYYNNKFKIVENEIIKQQ
jgi:hypothetical protein